MYFFAYFLFHINDIEHSGDIEQKRIFKNVKKKYRIFFFFKSLSVFYIICAVADELEKKSNDLDVDFLARKSEHSVFFPLANLSFLERHVLILKIWQGTTLITCEPDVTVLTL